MFELFTDTNTDCTPKIAQKYGYQLICMPYTLDDIQTTPYVDYKEFDYKAYYNYLRQGNIPKTYALNSFEYVDYFKPYLEQGKDILYVHFSRNMSGTFNSLDMAIKELKETYPERQIFTIDTKGVSVHSLNIVQEVGEMALQGKSVNEILEWANNEVDHFATYFFADTLKFFAKSGRVSNFSNVMGNFIGIKPILHMDQNGTLTNLTKIKGRKNALVVLVNYVQQLQLDLTKHKVIIAHSDAIDLAEDLAQMLQQAFNNELDIEFSVVNPTIGGHCGPDCVGVSFHALHR